MNINIYEYFLLFIANIFCTNAMKFSAVQQSLNSAHIRLLNSYRIHAFSYIKQGIVRCAFRIDLWKIFYAKAYMRLSNSRWNIVKSFNWSVQKHWWDDEKEEQEMQKLHTNVKNWKNSWNKQKNNSNHNNTNQKKRETTGKPIVYTR